MNRKQIQRFQKFIELDLLTGCWIWKGCLRAGYGIFQMNGKAMAAHRVAFTHWNGEIKIGLVMDHLCRTKNCVNPKHLEAVTDYENITRGISANRNKTHCKNGHEFTEENTYINQNLKRNCRKCHIQWTKDYLARIKCR